MADAGDDDDDDEDEEEDDPDVLGVLPDELEPLELLPELLLEEPLEPLPLPEPLLPEIDDDFSERESVR